MVSGRCVGGSELGKGVEQMKKCGEWRRSTWEMDAPSLPLDSEEATTKDLAITSTTSVVANHSTAHTHTSHHSLFSFHFHSLNTKTPLSLYVHGFIDFLLTIFYILHTIYTSIRALELL